jgi:MATE family multidrug resistance protein
MGHASSRTIETRRTLTLAGPVILTGLNWTLLQVTDVVVVGGVSTREAAALGASRSLTFVGIVTGLAWLSGVLVFAARADGAGDTRRLAAVLREGLALAAVLGTALGVVLFALAAPLLGLIGVAPDLVAPGAHVVRVIALGYPFQMVMIAAGFFLEGTSRPGRVAAVNVAILPVNAGLAWALAGGHAGLPGWGAAGAAAATALSGVLGAGAMLAAARRTVPAMAGTPPRLVAGVVRLARFGAMPALSSGLELAGFSILIALSTRLGDTAAHAFQIVFAAHNVTFALAIGLGSAAGVRAGNAVGEGRPAAATGRTLVALALAVAAMAPAALAMIAAPAALVALFPATAAVHALAGAMLPHWAPFIVFDGIQVVLVYALRSLGDQVVAGANSILAYFVVTGGVGWWLVGHGAGPMGLVWASGAGMVTAALLHGIRFALVSRRLARSG